VDVKSKSAVLSISPLKKTAINLSLYSQKSVFQKKNLPLTFNFKSLKKMWNVDTWIQQQEDKKPNITWSN